MLLREAQKRSQWTIAVLTPSYWRSAFTDFELRDALRTKRLIPILAKKCSIRAGVPNGAVIDFSDRKLRLTNAPRLWKMLEEETRIPEPRKVFLSSTEQSQLRTMRNKFERALSTGQVEEAFLVFRDRLFPLLHYRLGSYLDNADLALNLRLILPQNHEPCSRVISGPTLRPLTGSAIPFAAEGEHECPMAWTLTALGVTYRALWEASQAKRCFSRAHSIYLHHGIVAGTIVNKINLADIAWECGDLDRAYSLLKDVERSSRDIRDNRLRAIAHQDLGLRLAFAAQWSTSAKHLDRALGLAGSDRHRQAVILSHYARRDLLLLRWLRIKNSPRNARRWKHTAETARDYIDRAYRLFVSGRIERHRVRLMWLSGSLLLRLGNYPSARRLLGRALGYCRDLGLSEFEADILLDLARCERDLGRLKLATELDCEALDLAIRSGRELQRIDAHLVAGFIFLKRGSLRAARLEALRSLQGLATSEGSRLRPLVALREARALLQQVTSNNA
jgi:tetratricopeptide (TPR) repeat protein